MTFTIDFGSAEAIYVQLCNQIILGIANSEMKEGDSLPSVRQLAENIGINMHTVNKAYTVLRQEGYIKVDRRHGAVIAIDINKLNALSALTDEMRVAIARAMCHNVSSDEIHAIVDDIISEFEGNE